MYNDSTSLVSSDTCRQFLRDNGDLILASGDRILVSHSSMHSAVHSKEPKVFTSLRIPPGTRILSLVIPFIRVFRQFLKAQQGF